MNLQRSCLWLKEVQGNKNPIQFNRSRDEKAKKSTRSFTLSLLLRNPCMYRIQNSQKWSSNKFTVPYRAHRSTYHHFIENKYIIHMYIPQSVVLFVVVVVVYPRKKTFTLHSLSNSFSHFIFSILFVCFFVFAAFHRAIGNANLWLMAPGYSKWNRIRISICAYRDKQIKLLDIWPRKKWEKERERAKKEQEEKNRYCKLLLELNANVLRKHKQPKITNSDE